MFEFLFIYFICVCVFFITHSRKRIFRSLWIFHVLHLPSNLFLSFIHIAVSVLIEACGSLENGKKTRTFRILLFSIRLKSMRRQWILNCVKMLNKKYKCTQKEKLIRFVLSIYCILVVRVCRIGGMRSYIQAKWVKKESTIVTTCVYGREGNE